MSLVQHMYMTTNDDHARRKKEQLRRFNVLMEGLSGPSESSYPLAHISRRGGNDAEFEATSKKTSLNQRKSIAVPTRDKPSRAHSIVPGATLSPFSKARRSLAPRKSILKSSIVPNVDRSSQQSTSSLEDHILIRSMEIPQVFSAPLCDNMTRKSLAHRVSFANNTEVRMFNKSRKQRSSIRYSIVGIEDMDMTTVRNPAIYSATGSAILDQEFGYEDNFDDDDMDITEAILGNFLRKRSLSVGRRQLSLPPEIDDEVNESQSDYTNESTQSAASDEHSRIMEFTVPLGQSLRPAIQDATWLALKQMTPTDSVQYDEGDGMNLEDTLERLRRARDSLPLSLGPYGNIVQSMPLQTSKPPEIAQELESAFAQVKPSVFQPPATSSVVGSAVPHSSVFTRPSSSSKVKSISSRSKLSRPKPAFPAVDPPVTKPSPKKPVPSVQIPAKRPRTTNEDDVDTTRPSPTKKQVLADEWTEAMAGKEDVRISAQHRVVVSMPKQLSPSKKALFQIAGLAVNSSIAKGIKRPSEYFARRKSLAASTSQTILGPTSFSPKKAADFRHLSVGSVSPVSRLIDQNLKPRNHPAEDFPTISEGIHKISGSTPTSITPEPAPLPQTPQGLHLTENSEAFEQPVAPAPAIKPPIEGDSISQGVVADFKATRQWGDAVQQDEYVDGDDFRTISISQFFQMTGIKYMDELAAPHRSLHRRMQPIPQSRNVSDIPLSEFVTAMAIDVPQLDLYSQVSKDLEAWIEKSKVVFTQAEEEAAKVTPELFIEYARADEVDQEELGHQLALIQTHTKYLARSDWYDWKLQWVEGLCHTASEALKSLENDSRALEGHKTTADAIIPDLEKEYKQLMQELEKEQGEVKEIESCDQDYLNELKASITEQK